jgi:hypothetical protein
MRYVIDIAATKLMLYNFFTYSPAVYCKLEYGSMGHDGLPSSHLESLEHNSDASRIPLEVGRNHGWKLDCSLPLAIRLRKRRFGFKGGGNEPWAFIGGSGYGRKRRGTRRSNGNQGGQRVPGGFYNCWQRRNGKCSN